jgi:predicted amidohydrolase
LQNKQANMAIAIRTPVQAEPVTSAGPSASSTGTLALAEARPWICRPEIAPRVWREGDALACESNGSEGCYGGWELVFRAPSPVGWPTTRLQLEIEVGAEGLARGTDALVVEAFWHDSPDPDSSQIEWDPLFLADEDPASVSPTLDAPTASKSAHGTGRFIARYVNLLRIPTVPPRGATGGSEQSPGVTETPEVPELRVRCGLRWTDGGTARWHNWHLTPAPPEAPHRRLRLGVASAQPPQGSDRDACTAFFLDQGRLAGEAGIDLVCLPELILASGMPRSPQAVQAISLPVPGEWLAPFQERARSYRMGICFSVHERAGVQGETVYNTAILLGREGELIGKYRKVHLALAEARNGVAGGHEFPVFDFDGVTVGLAVCMDSTPLETARILAQRGAEVLLMPIMGDFRATPWAAGDSRFHRERWEAIQRAHALDNHLYVVASRNTTQGSAVTTPWGEIVAYDNGTQGLIWADVDVDDVRSHPKGSTIRSVIQSMRRPAVYGALLDGAMAPLNHRDAV